MRLGIDASNLRQGGGLTHLRELLAAGDPGAAGITEVTVWAGKTTLDTLPVRPWLRPVHHPLLEKNLFARRYWQSVILERLATRSVDLVFAPGATHPGSYRPFVTMSRNLLPFDPPERARYDGSLMGLRLRALSVTQTYSFKRAAGVIFLTKTAEQLVTAQTGDLPGLTRVIPHGIGDAFFQDPRPQRPLESYSMDAPFKWLYVSIVDLYKHQARVAEACAALRAEGAPVSAEFVGPAYAPALAELRAVMTGSDPGGAFLTYRGAYRHQDLPALYRHADGSIFASSCENMPNILLESMASGLPIACSNRSVMPEVLGDAGVYCDPESASSIFSAMKTLMGDAKLRGRCAGDAFARARQYSWQRCARETFQFIADVADNAANPARRGHIIGTMKHQSAEMATGRSTD